MTIILFDQIGRRLKGGMFCKDKKLRDFPPFGTPAWTVKVYQSMPAAKKAARYHNLAVAMIPDSMTVDSAGNVCFDGSVFKDTPDGPKRRTINDFVVQPQNEGFCHPC